MLILVRHGSTEWNDSTHELIRGHLDIPLSEKGKRDIQEVAHKVAAKYSPSAIWSDQLERSRDTAQAIAHATGSIPILDSRLSPWNIGKLAGQFKDEVRPTIQFLVENPDSPVPGGETYNEFYKRWSNRFNEARRASGVEVMVVHSSNFHALPSILAGHGPEYDDGVEVKPGNFMVIE